MCFSKYNIIPNHKAQKKELRQVPFKFFNKQRVLFFE